MSSRHDHQRRMWAPGQIWETRIEECAGDEAAWVPVGDRGRAQPAWDERQEYRLAICRAEQRAPGEWICDCAAPGPACKPSGWRGGPPEPKPADVPSIYDVVPPRAHKWLEGYAGAASSDWLEGWDSCRLQCRKLLDAHLQRSLGSAPTPPYEKRPADDGPRASSDLARDAKQSLFALRGGWDTRWADQAIAAIDALDRIASFSGAEAAFSDRQQQVIRFALWGFANAARGNASAAGQDKDNQLFKPGAVDAFLKDAQDAEQLLTLLRSDPSVLGGRRRG